MYKNGLVHSTNWNVHFKETTDNLACRFKKKKNKTFFLEKKKNPLVAFKTAHLAWLVVLLPGFVIHCVGGWLYQKGNKRQGSTVTRE